MQQQDSLTQQRIDVEERHTDAMASALLSKAEQELLAWFDAPRETLNERLDALSKDEVRVLLENVRQLVNRQESRFTCMLEIGSALGTTFHIDDLLKMIVEKTTELMDAERSTIFILDQETGELWSKIIQGTVNIEIRLRPGQGVAGWVAETGQSLNIRDAYQDERFNPKVDENTGYQTRNILCQPIRNLKGDILGVIQVLNRVTGNFTDSDEQMLSAIASQAAVAIENSKLYLAAVAQNMELIEIKDKLEHKVAELDMLFELERLIGQAASVDELVNSVFRRTTRLAHAQMASLKLRGSRLHDVYLLQDRGEWENDMSFEHRRIEPSATWPTLGLHKDESYRWKYQDSEEQTDTHDALDEILRAREVQVDDDELDTFLAHRGKVFEAEIQNLMVIPLFDDDGVELGSFELFNTIEEDDDGELGFGDDERKILTLVAAQLTASIVARRRREEEEKNSRLASIGQMLSGVLHDLKNPMAIISGYVQLMAKADDPERRKLYADSVLTQFEQLNQMTRELLMFARGDQHILLRKVFLHKFMAEVQELLEPELHNKGVQLEVELKYRNDIKIDQVKLKRAILNLARNAAEAMGPRGGVFKVHVCKVKEGECEAFEQEHVLMTLSDNGPGIPEEIRDRLFESFVTQGKKDGTGLGLAIVEKIVTDHGGTIDFETETGEGTTFFIRLPLHQQSATKSGA